MKISYRTHPILRLINGELNDVMINPAAPNLFVLVKGLNYVFTKEKDKFFENIIVVSESFQDAALAVNEKMIDNNLYKEIGDNLSGVLLFKNLSIVYEAKRTTINGVGAWTLNIIEFFAGNCLNTLCWSGIANYTDSKDETPIEAAKSVWRFVQMVLMFKRFAPVETKELLPNQKIKGIECKYINETNQKLTYLTSAWFTNLVKSDAFKVRGHFRLQPKKKNGGWTKELIWINEFQKDGYTRKAGIIGNIES